MKRPSWATTVAVLGFIVGGYRLFTSITFIGLSGSAPQIGASMNAMQKTIEDPKVQKQMLEAAQKMSEAMAEQMKKQGVKFTPPPASTTDPAPQPQTNMPIPKFPEIPGYFDQIMKIGSYVSLVAAVLLILGAVTLLSVKPIAIKFCYWAIGLSLGFAILKNVVLVTTVPMLGMAMAVGSIFGIIVDLLLLFMVATGDKTAFHETPQTA